MKHCEKCHVDVSTKRQTCPLCGQFLIDTEAKKEILLSEYPPYKPIVKEYNLLLRIIYFLGITGIILSAVVNWLTYEGVAWAIYVGIGVVYLFVLLKNTIMSKKPIARKLIVQMLVLSILIFGVDYYGGFARWSLDYVIPALSIATTLSIILVVLIKPMRYEDYVIYMFLTVFLGFIPFVFYLFKIVNVLWPSISAAGLSLAVMIGMITFADRKTKNELKKRFHI